MKPYFAVLSLIDSLSLTGHFDLDSRFHNTQLHQHGTIMKTFPLFSAIRNALPHRSRFTSSRSRWRLLRISNSMAYSLPSIVCSNELRNTRTRLSSNNGHGKYVPWVSRVNSGFNYRNSQLHMLLINLVNYNMVLLREILLFIILHSPKSGGSWWHYDTVSVGGWDLLWWDADVGVSSPNRSIYVTNYHRNLPLIAGEPTISKRVNIPSVNGVYRTSSPHYFLWF